MNDIIQIQEKCTNYGNFVERKKTALSSDIVALVAESNRLSTHVERKIKEAIKKSLQTKGSTVHDSSKEIYISTMNLRDYKDLKIYPLLHHFYRKSDDKGFKMELETLQYNIHKLDTQLAGGSFGLGVRKKKNKNKHKISK